MILAVDTSLGSAVALVAADGATLVEAARADGLGHAEAIGFLLQQAVAATEGSRISHVVVGMGPGPFTGLRIGIAAARTFALGRDLPIVPVPSHLALALAAIEEEGQGGPFAVVTDARRREAAVTVYEGLDVDGIPHAVVDTLLVPRADVETRLGGIRIHEASALSAAALARVGRRAVAAGRVLSGDEPLYLRAPDAVPQTALKRVGA